MYDLGIITLIAIAAFVMLIRGDPKWTLPPLIGAFALLGRLTSFLRAPSSPWRIQRLYSS